MSSRLQYLVIQILWALLIGLILHFVVYNFVTFVLGLSGGLFSAVRMRKEIGVWLLCAIVWYQIYLHRFDIHSCVLPILPLDRLTKNPQIRRLIVFVLCITLVRSLISAWYTDTSVTTYILALRYDFLGFILWLCCIYLSQYLHTRQIQSFFTVYLWIVKIVLMLWLCRYVILVIKPGVLKLAGYTTKIYEGEVGKQPPAVYYTQQFQWYARNQFVFERPIHYGFRLVAMWPFFFMRYLRRKSREHTSVWWILYGLNIVTTFSRAARWVWILQTIVLVLYTYRKNVHIYLKKIIIPLICGAVILSVIGYQQIIDRDYSNTGHLNLLMQGLGYVADHRIVGLGPGSVWPASYHEWWLEFNPENQFVQILIEFGIVWFVWWMIVYGFFSLFGLQYRNDFLNRKKKHISPSTLMAVASSISMCGLAISGLVLHSFVDRMIVLPIMILVWLSIGWKLYHKG